MSKKERCPAGVDNMGAVTQEGASAWYLDPPPEMRAYPYDRCRRFAGHDGWHLPDAGCAVTDKGQWITGPHWMVYFAAVEESGGIFA